MGPAMIATESMHAETVDPSDGVVAGIMPTSSTAESISPGVETMAVSRMADVQAESHETILRSNI